jgi:NAD(P)-dependent dehydrogenase (short-subunit alcohol dehydrogenase family)
MVRGLVSELGPHAVRVNAIIPSIQGTPLAGPLKVSPEIWNALSRHTVLDQWSEQSEVAAAIALLASHAASYVTGPALPVDGGCTAIEGPPTGDGGPSVRRTAADI